MLPSNVRSKNCGFSVLDRKFRLKACLSSKQNYECTALEKYTVYTVNIYIYIYMIIYTYIIYLKMCQSYKLHSVIRAFVLRM